MSRAIVFPGQGSQIVGMAKDLYESYSEARDLFKKANDILNYDLGEICFNGPQEKLNLSNFAQLGIFVSSIAFFKVLNAQQKDLEIDYFAGHSLGEWTALNAAKYVSFEDTLKILEARGRFMQEACELNNGAMIAVINLDSNILEEITKESGCFIANYNSLQQTVLSGNITSIEKAKKLSIDAGAKRVIPLPVAGAFHSPLMTSAAKKMEDYISKIVFSDSNKPVLSNVTGYIHNFFDMKENMVKQITSSVKWVQIIKNLSKNGTEEIIECGPGRVLTGLIKRIDKNIEVRNISNISEI
ncbi:MAG: ACP S-malonyltransferase [Verrucomicrobiota bacterium]|nr:ACP S-malonyltransferase [Verrucomicrobiota bacterium]